ncbi:acyl--CoA ligase [Lysinibacillus sp. 2017]|uniref:acyl-CoA synthetase MbcS n=1 Tax=unclassified Lysinibacillus TaxID=2636778 RepID=UPI000D52A3ED|nr:MULTISPECIES: acyl--CoA ligase [unclassified Lysinibacillus]AWE08337.1 acyl--CoA ligase [Lysinibacillus sp. 2017]TGN35814.1 acyl--CoA ligase [Lysinibacillus sp. S2017]
MNHEHLIAPKMFNIVDEFEKHENKETKTALIIQEENSEQTSYTYEALLQQANQVANVFQAQGLKKGDVILIMLPRCLEAYVAYIAALKAGLVIIPSSELLRAKDIDYRLIHSEAKAIIVNDQFIQEFEQVQNLANVTCFIVGDERQNWQSLTELAKLQSMEFTNVATTSDDLAFLAYTSGTTGNPKGVMHSHGWGYAHLRTAAAAWLGVQDGDIVWATAAPGWQKWIWSPFLAVLGSGAAGFVYKGKFDAKKYLHCIEVQKINVLCCTPTEYRMMAKLNDLGDYHLDSLRSAVSAGEPLNREVIETFKREHNLIVRDGYGQTENTLLIGTLLDTELRSGSMGKPTPGNLIELVNEFGEPVAVGEVGDIAVHKSTPALFKGYYKDMERTAIQYRGDWYVTGDRATKDDEGYFWFEGRNDDIIISSGYTIGPFEVEDALTKHPDVQECAVVASPDEMRGNVVKAFVVLKDPALKEKPTMIEELQNHVKELTAPYKYPRIIEFLDELPKTISGKIRRVELRLKERS